MPARQGSNVTSQKQSDISGIKHVALLYDRYNIAMCVCTWFVTLDVLCDIHVETQARRCRSANMQQMQASEWNVKYNETCNGMALTYALQPYNWLHGYMDACAGQYVAQGIFGILTVTPLNEVSFKASLKSCAHNGSLYRKSLNVNGEFRARNFT